MKIECTVKELKELLIEESVNLETSIGLKDFNAENKQILLEEIRRLNRLNIIHEKNILAEKAIQNEPEQIVKNTLAISEIAKIVKN